MRALFALFALAASLGAPSVARASWTCTVREQVDEHVSGMLFMTVLDDGTQREMSFYVDWSDQPGHGPRQRAIWTWIPLDAERLWKPDEIGFEIQTPRTDMSGAIIFRAEGREQIVESPRNVARSLRPTFPTTWVKAENGYLIGRLWEGWPWTVEHMDRRGRTLGTQALLLPGPEGSQALFARLRRSLAAAAADPGARCTAHPQPTQQELLEQII